MVATWRVNVFLALAVLSIFSATVFARKSVSSDDGDEDELSWYVGDWWWKACERETKERGFTNFGPCEAARDEIEERMEEVIATWNQIESVSATMPRMRANPMYEMYVRAIADHVAKVMYDEKLRYKPEDLSQHFQSKFTFLYLQVITGNTDFKAVDVVIPDYVRADYPDVAKEPEIDMEAIRRMIAEQEAKTKPGHTSDENDPWTDTDEEL